MTTILPTDSDWQTGKSLLECNKYMLEQEIACDIKFLVGKKKQEVRAHKHILIIRSPVFQAMFCGPLAETQTAIPIPDIEPESFIMLLRYMYCDERELVGEHDVIEILYAAKKYFVNGLMKACIAAIEKIIDVNNACVLLESADNFDEQGLYRMCYTFLLEEGEACLQSDSFCNLSEDSVKKIISADNLMATELTVWRSIFKWTEAECRRQKHVVSSTAMGDILGDLLYCVRFRSVTAEEFAKIVFVIDILNEKEKISIFKFCRTEKKTIDRFSMKKKRSIHHRYLQFQSCSKIVTYHVQDILRYLHQKLPLTCGTNFIVSDPIRLSGIILYRSITVPCSHNLCLCKMHGDVLLRFTATSDEQEENATVDEVMFPHEIQLEQNTQYGIYVQSTHAQLYMGQNCQNVVKNGDTSITFSQRANCLPMPGLIFRKL